MLSLGLAKKKKCDYIFQLHYYFSRVCVHVHWCKDTCTYMCVHVEARSQAQISFLRSHPPCFWDRVSLVRFYSLANKPYISICLSFSPQYEAAEVHHYALNLKLGRASLLILFSSLKVCFFLLLGVTMHTLLEEIGNWISRPARTYWDPAFYCCCFVFVLCSIISHSSFHIHFIMYVLWKRLARRSIKSSNMVYLFIHLKILDFPEHHL